MEFLMETVGRTFVNNVSKKNMNQMVIWTQCVQNLNFELFLWVLSPQ